MVRNPLTHALPLPPLLVSLPPRGAGWRPPASEPHYRFTRQRTAPAKGPGDPACSDKQPPYDEPCVLTRSLRRLLAKSSPPGRKPYDCPDDNDPEKRNKNADRHTHRSTST